MAKTGPIWTQVVLKQEELGQ